MATLGIEALTMSDLRKRSNFDGSVDFIIEALENSNPVLQDMVWTSRPVTRLLSVPHFPPRRYDSSTAVLPRLSPTLSR